MTTSAVSRGSDVRLVHKHLTPSVISILWQKISAVRSVRGLCLVLMKRLRFSVFRCDKGFYRISCSKDFFFYFEGHQSYLWGHWYLLFGLLVTSAWGSKKRWIPRLHDSLPVCNGFLRFTSRLTPDDLLTLTFQQSCFWSALEKALVGSVKDSFFVFYSLAVQCQFILVGLCEGLGITTLCCQCKFTSKI